MIKLLTLTYTLGTVLGVFTTALILYFTYNLLVYEILALGLGLPLPKTHFVPWLLIVIGFVIYRILMPRKKA